MRLVERVDTPVMFVAVRDRSDEIGPGWDHLESVLGSLRGRRFVGAFDDSGLYRCSVQVREGDHAGQLGLDCGVIPGGLFLAATVRGAQPAAYALLISTFEELQRSALWDRTRPSLEYYRRHDRIDVLMPILSRWTGDRESERRDRADSRARRAPDDTGGARPVVFLVPALISGGLAGR